MITLKNDCDDCLHNKICRFKDYAKHDMNKLKDTQYGEGPNDDYDWDIILRSRHVSVEFSCTDFKPKIEEEYFIDNITKI